MIASVGFEDLSVRCVVGVHAEERVARQQLGITVTMDYDPEDAVAQDSIADAVDYAAAATLVEELAEEGRYHLLETLAAAIIRALREAFPQLERVDVRIRKPGAIAGAKAAVARMEWHREQGKVAPTG